MNVNVPDKIYKLAVAIGIAAFIYSQYLRDITWTRYEKAFSSYQDQLYIVKKLKLVADYDLQRMKEESKALSKKYNVENPIEVKNSTVSFNKTLQGDQNEILVTDKLKTHWNKYLSDNFKLEQEQLILDKKDAELESEIDYRDATFDKEVEPIIDISITLFLIGVLLWLSEEYKSAPIIKQSDKIYSRCQSCGTAFSSIKLYGTNKDGTYNLGLCSTCYVDGEFVDMNFDDEQYKTFIEEKIKSHNRLNKIIYRLKYYNLERWRT